MYQQGGNRGRSPSRPIRSDAPPEGRRLWEIGSWGNASDHIGRRWEDLGHAAMSERLLGDRSLWGGASAPTLVALTDDRAVQARFQSLGLTNPDALLLAPGDGRLVVRPVDFKWSLETASYRQISGSALAELLGHADSPLPALIHQVRQDGDAELAAADGFFFAPDSQPNRQFVDSPANRRQEFPIEPKEVVFQHVEGVAFFGVLPWWPQALRLAELDRSARALESLEGAERYYRFGAGLGGALVKLHTSVFAAEPATLDVAAEVEDLLRQHHLRGSLEALEHLRQLLAQRDERLRRAKDLTRCPYGFREFMGELARRGSIPPDWEEDPTKAAKERWGPVHREIAEAHRAAVNAAGRQLLAQGSTEAAALAALERRRQEFEDRARVQARRVIERELG